jgi:hypothetical protein
MASLETLNIVADGIVEALGFRRAGNVLRGASTFATEISC